MGIIEAFLKLSFADLFALWWLLVGLVQYVRIVYRTDAWFMPILGLAMLPIIPLFLALEIANSEFEIYLEDGDEDAD